MTISNSHLSMTFTGSALRLRNVRTFKGKSEVFAAASGNKQSQPIPPGTYWVNTAEVHRMSLSDDWTPRGFSKPMLILNEMLQGRIVGAVWNGVMLHMAAWGEFRIPIRQTEAQQLRSGRSNLFIHGGDSPGSAGCIDLGHQIGILVAILQKEHARSDNRRIPLEVIAATNS